MIRQKSLHCKLKLIKTKVSDIFTLYDKALQQVLLHIGCMSCPACGIKNSSMILYGHYNRWVIVYNNGPVRVNLCVQRLLCKTCLNSGHMHTHAVLPDLIVPYKQYSIQFIITVLKAYYSHSMTVEAICEKAQITPVMLYSWDRMFVMEYESWMRLLTTAEQESYHAKMLEFLTGIYTSDDFSEMIYVFYRITIRSFMQSHCNPPNSHNLI